MNLKPNARPKAPFLRALSADYIASEPAIPGYVVIGGDLHHDDPRKLRVEDLADLHYITDRHHTIEPATPESSFIQFKTGALFETPLDMRKLLTALRLGDDFDVRYHGKHDGYDALRETFYVMRKKPDYLLMDLSDILIEPITLFLHPRPGCLGNDYAVGLAQFLQASSLGDIKTETFEEGSYQKMMAFLKTEFETGEMAIAALLSGRSP